jgi:hypothetical protein
VFAFIEGFYNPRRRHSSIGYLSPIDYEHGIMQEPSIATHTSLPPCSRPSRTSPSGGRSKRPSLTATARGGGASLRSGRKNACGAVEQKNGIEKERSGKALAFRAAIRERKNGSAGGRTKECHQTGEDNMT